MTKGEAVLVYPHGSPEQSAVGTIILISSNERSIAVSFDSMPPFAFAKGPVAIHPDFGVVLLAGREEIDGKAWGPWVEVGGGGHYEIEGDYHD